MGNKPRILPRPRAVAAKLGQPDDGTIIKIRRAFGGYTPLPLELFVRICNAYDLGPIERMVWSLEIADARERVLTKRGA